MLYLDLKAGGRIGVGRRHFFSFKTPRPALECTHFPVQCVPDFFQGVYRLRREVNHSPPSTAEINNQWIFTSTPLYTFKAWTGKNLSYLSW